MQLYLDIGSGSQPRGNVHIDIPDSQYHRGAGNRLRIEAMNFNYASAERIPFKDNVFDRVTIHHVLEHIENPLATIRDVKRVLRKGGRLIIMIPSEFNIGYGATGHIYTWNVATLEHFLRKAFDNVYVGYVARKTMISRKRKIVKKFPWLIPLFGKLGLHPELYARCVK